MALSKIKLTSADVDKLPLYLTPAETTQLFRVAPVTLKKRRAAGLPPPFVKVGGRILYKREDVLSLLKPVEPKK